MGLITIKVVTYAPYPNGMALTRRIHHYCKGIIEAGGKAEIIIIGPTERSSNSAKNTIVKGIYEGVGFEYTCGTTIRSGSFSKRRWFEIKGIVRATMVVVRDREDTDAVLLVTNFWPYILYFALVCKILGMLFLQEKSEFPFFNRTPQTFFERFYQAIYKRYIYRCFDGLLVISNPLYEFFKCRLRRKAQLLLVPPIVDPEEFSMKRNNVGGLTIVCCGTLTQKKDGVLTLIQAFKKVCNKFDNLKLCLVGGGPGSKNERESRQLVRELCLEDRVIFTGYVTREKLMQVMCNASILALAKPSSLQADYCFPSKIGEYLATGNPVVVTDTGEISRYLQDGVNAFIVEPDSKAAFTRKLEFVLSNPELAREVGQRGKEVALSTFDYRTQAKRLISIIKELQASRLPWGGFCSKHRVTGKGQRKEPT